MGTLSQVRLDHKDLRFCSGLSEAACRLHLGVEEKETRQHSSPDASLSHHSPWEDGFLTDSG